MLLSCLQIQRLIPIIYNSKVMKICENDNGEMYYCDINNENIVITNELSFTKNGIVYRNIKYQLKIMSLQLLDMLRILILMVYYLDLHYH